jgi:PIF1-like helicase
MDMTIISQEPNAVSTIDSFITNVFGLSISSSTDKSNNKAILCPHNEYSRRISDIVMQRMNEDLITFRSADASADKSEAPDAIFPINFINSLNPTGLSQHC